MNGVPGLTPPRILLLGTGGTIAMASDAGGAIKPALQADELVRAVPALERIAALETVAYSNKPGATLTLRDLASLSDVIADGFDRGCQGAVVVQGTDTIEETAFALELLARSTLPVVVTGAMRGAQAPGADGPSNLLAAVTVAASPDAAGLGTLVVLGDEAHAARHVQKTHTTLPSAFRSPGAGPLGTIQEGQFRLFGWQAPLPALRVAAARLDETGRLAAHRAGRRRAHAARAAATGLSGRGHRSHGRGPRAGVAGAGHRRTGGANAGRAEHARGGRSGAAHHLRLPGSESDLLSRGAIHGGSLGGLKARLLLRLLLAAGYQGASLRAEFACRSLADA